MSLKAVLKEGPGTIELPRSASPLVKANQLLYAHFERAPISEQRKAFFWILASFAPRAPKMSCSCEGRGRCRASTACVGA